VRFRRAPLSCHSVKCEVVARIASSQNLSPGTDDSTTRHDSQTQTACTAGNHEDDGTLRYSKPVQGIRLLLSVHKRKILRSKTRISRPVAASTPKITVVEEGHWVPRFTAMRSCAPQVGMAVTPGCLHALDADVGIFTAGGRVGPHGPSSGPRWPLIAIHRPRHTRAAAKPKTTSATPRLVKDGNRRSR